MTRPAPDKTPRPAPRPIPEAFAARVEKAWQEALATIPGVVLLRPPLDDPSLDTVAAIELRSRQVLVNLRMVSELGLPGSLASLFAHEFGHHLRYPRELRVKARLQILTRRLGPRLPRHTPNLIEDLLVDSELVPVHRAWMIEVMRRLFELTALAPSRLTLLFFLAYEELWDLRPGALLGFAAEGLEAEIPGSRQQTREAVQDLPGLAPDIYRQFLRMALLWRGWLKDREPDADPPILRGCPMGQPSDEDWAATLTPDAAEDAALADAQDRGLLSQGEAGRLRKPRALEAGLEDIRAQAGGKSLERIAALHYRRLAERHRLPLPPRPALGDGLVPVDFAAWEPGDPVGDLDWGATLVRGGRALAPAMAVRRLRHSEATGHDAATSLPRLELFLDTSGSMPDPTREVNPMTLAAMVLLESALAAGGTARLLRYSEDFRWSGPWSQDREALGGFLMGWMGKGTLFPFEELERSASAEASRAPTRVVLSDQDFDGNFAQHPLAAHVLRHAASRSRPLVLVLHRASPARAATYRSLGARTVAVPSLAAFPRIAGDLARELFDPEGGKR